MTKKAVPFSRNRPRGRGSGGRGPGSRGRSLQVSQFRVLWLLIFAAVFAFGWYSTERAPQLFKLPKIGTHTPVAMSFGICSSAHGGDCVIDGDTFKYQGQSIRIADIDAPETHPSRCEYEAQLGAQATHRLRELLNDGPFTLAEIDRDEDQYGRKLRIVMRDGRSLGGILVAEHLARPWTGHREPWCT